MSRTTSSPGCRYRPSVESRPRGGSPSRPSRDLGSSPGAGRPGGGASISPNGSGETTTHPTNGRATARHRPPWRSSRGRTPRPTRASASSSGVTSQGPKMSEVLALGRSEADVDSSRWRSRADQSLRRRVAADRLLGALGGRSRPARIDQRPDLEAQSRALLTRAAPRRRRPVREPRRRSRSRRSAGGTRPRGSRPLGAPTSSRTCPEPV